MLRGKQGESGERSDRTHTQRVPYREICGRCGAKREDKQLGLERTPEEYVGRVVEVFAKSAACFVTMELVAQHRRFVFE